MSEQAILAPPPPRADGAPAPAVEPAPPSRPRQAWGVVVLLLGVAIALLAGLLITVGRGGNLRAELVGGDGTAEAKVGDCLTGLPRDAGAEGRSADDARVARCGSATAAYEVVGRVQDATAARTRVGSGCEPYFKPGDDGYILYRVGDDDGYLLCLVRTTNRR